MGYIDDPSLLQRIIDTLNLKVLPGEQQLPYPLPVFPGVSQVINLNDFLKTKTKIVTMEISETADVLAGGVESTEYKDLFIKNKLYRLINLGVQILAPPASTIGNHVFDIYHSPHAQNGVIDGTAAYNIDIVFNKNSFVSVFTGRGPVSDEVLAAQMKETYFSVDVPFNITYTNNTDVTQTNPRNYYFVLLVERVKGL